MPELFFTVSELERAWRDLPGALGHLPDYFRAPTFYIALGRAYIGVEDASGKPALLLDVQQCEQCRLEVQNELGIEVPYLSKHKSYINMEPVYITNSQDFVGVLKQLGRLSKQNRYKCPMLKEKKNAIDSVDSIQQRIRNDFTVIAFDVEMWEKQHSIVLEIGYAQYRVESGNVVSRDHHHFLVKENTGYKNSQFIQGRPECFSSDLGTTETISLSESLQRFQAAIDSSDIIVGHSMFGDLQSLPGVEFLAESRMLADTAEIYAKMSKDAVKGNQVSVKNMVRNFGMRDRYVLHNAGNDAFYTLAGFFKMLLDIDITGLGA